jgi:PAS domain S-box-containing protein
MTASPGTSWAAGARLHSEIDSHAVSVATGALRRIADLLPADRLLVLAISDPTGAVTDLVVRNPDGRLAVVAGVPEHRRPDLAQLVAVAAGEIEVETAAEETSTGGEDVHRTVVEESPLPLMLLDREGAIAYASPSVAYDLGWNRAELVGHRLLDFVHADDRERAAHMLSRAAGGPRWGTAMTLRWRRRRGGYVAVEAAIRAVERHSGEPPGAAVIGLRTSPIQWSGLGEIVLAEQRQRALADGADAGMAIVSGSEAALGAVLEANAPLGRILGATTGQLAGLSLTSLVADADADRVRDALRRVTVGGEPSKLDVTVVPSLGRHRQVLMTITPVPPDDQSQSELIVRVRDMTEQQGLVAELTKAVDHLERSNEELAGLARITAHDLAAPLRALSGLIDLLPQGDTNADTLLTLDAIHSAIDRMQAMVGGVIGYVQVRSERTARTQVDLNELLARVRETLETDVLERRAVIVTEELPTVYGDEHQLERVLQNLISNALKYSPEDSPQVRVAAHREPRAWEISVGDQGVGVDEADRERIFELFGRAGTEAGSGIGLATCRRVVELHGGRIWVEQNEPRGSIFKFTIPDEPTVAGG